MSVYRLETQSHGIVLLSNFQWMGKCLFISYSHGVYQAGALEVWESIYKQMDMDFIFL